MFGFIVGTMCLVGLVATVRRRRHFHYAYGPYGRFRHGRRFWLRGLFAELDTTPGQEKAIVGALDKMRERARGLRESALAGRKELAAALGGDVLDRAALEAVLTRQNQLVGTLGEGLRETLANVHEVLDAEQRKRLAELIAEGSLPYAFHRRQAC